MPEALRVQILRSTGELEDFAPTWRELWASDPHATPFQHPAWLLPWWRQFGQPELRAAVLRRGARPTGLLPLYIYSDPGSGQRKLLPLGAGTTDYLDGAFDPECTASDVRGGLDVLVEDGGWDVLDVLQLRRNSRLAEALAGMLGAQRFAATPCWRTPAVAMSELPQKVRRNAMYYRNRAARQGTLSLEFAESETRAAIFDNLVRLHTQRWRTAGKPGVLADPRVLAWHRDSLPALQEAGLLRLYSLQLDDATLAVAYALGDPPRRAAQGVDRTEYVYIPAYSAEHASLRPGTVLLALGIEQAARDGIRTVDLLRGDEDYKRLWRVSPVPTLGYNFRHPARTSIQAA